MITYTGVELLESGHVVEVVHDLLLVPALDVGHEVDASGEVTVVVFSPGFFLIAGCFLEVLVVQVAVRWMIYLRRERRHGKELN